MTPCWIVRALFLLGVASRTVSLSRLPVNDYDVQQTTASASAGVTTEVTNTTKSDAYPASVGFIAAGIAVLFFGSNFVPIKKYETGDGVFFQWVLCTGIFLTGLVVQMVRQSTFHSLVMVGGVIWATANMCVVPIFKTIGMALGMCIWGMFNLLGGWASGRFGWFWIDPQVPKHEALNYAGVALAVSSTVIYTFVKNTVTTPAIEFEVEFEQPTETQPLITHRTQSSINTVESPKVDKDSINTVESPKVDKSSQSVFERWPPVYKKIVGVALSVISGFMYGICFAPSIHVQDRVKGASQNSLDYVFAQYCGIFLTSSVYFVVYTAWKRNKPQVYPEVILPALVGGVMWAIATGCWFVANKALSEPVAFPIVSTIPGAIASLFWGVFVFKEIKGIRNILILLVAVTITAAGAILAGISKG
ncbi:transmembrane protein 144-like isoform X1 [Babylonia areolata]|uniref:transmembrane protein 144-like isoform X1 n=1 Tax=Babylonia areolata TaxID=304850 RepID=UPI003FD071A2